MSQDDDETKSYICFQLLHGFDDTGRLYNHNGKKESWWPSTVIKAFKAKTECFVDQYSREIFSGGFVDGRQTLSENIADNGGLVSAYQGYRTWLKDHSAKTMSLPGKACD